MKHLYIGLQVTEVAPLEHERLLRALRIIFEHQVNYSYTLDGMADAVIGARNHSIYLYP